MTWSPFGLRRHRGVRGAGGRLARGGVGRRRGNAAAARDRAARRSAPPRIPSAPPTTRSSPRTSGRSATSRTSTSSAARPTSTRWPAPRSGRGPHARTRRTRRASSCAGRRRPRASAATSSWRCSTRPTGSTSTSAGRWRTARWCATATPGSGITDKPIDVRGAEEVRPRALRLAVVRQPAARSTIRATARTPSRPSTRRARARGRTEDGLAWDIYSQVGALLRSRDRANPLAYRGSRHDWRGGHGGHAAVKHVYGFGYSQTGGYLYDYINAIHPLDVARNGGHPIYDGYIVAVAGGGLRGHRADQPVRGHRRRAGDPRLQFSNVGVPIIHVMSQSDYLFGIDARRPDSDAPADRFRHYEMAGAAHATPDELNFAATSADIVKAGVAVPPMNCDEAARAAASRAASSSTRCCATSTSGCATGSGRPTPTRSRWRTGRGVLDQFGNVVGRPALALPRRADEHVVRQLARRRGSASSPATRCRSTRRSCSSSTRPTAPTSARWSRTRRGSWPGATSPPTTAST